jgi:hypothetical protein
MRRTPYAALGWASWALARSENATTLTWSSGQRTEATGPRLVLRNETIRRALRCAEIAGWGFRWLPWLALASLVPRSPG